MRRRLGQTSACEILIVGNEILSGVTLDTNSQWISRRVSRLGGRVTRETTVLDDVDEIASAVRETIGRGSKTLIVVGGLGPTYDDKTLRGLAAATRRPLRLNKRALGMVRNHYRKFRGELEMTRHRTKMATLPRGASPLANPVGTAPGVKLTSRGTTIFALPGVPSEMKEIFTLALAPFLRKRFGAVAYAEHNFKLHGIMESELAPVLDLATSRFPSVYVKSHPKGYEHPAESVLEIHLSTRARSKSTAKRMVRAAARFILAKTRSISRKSEVSFGES